MNPNLRPLIRAPPPVPRGDFDCDVLVLGSGPGGYTAAFRAADLGLDVVLVERYPDLGGVCLNVGCIPSKALLHTANVLDEAASMAEHGVKFGEPEIELDPLRAWKDKVVGQLTGGLAGMAGKRGVRVITGQAEFTAGHEVAITGDNGTEQVSFAQAIIAAGSQSMKLPGLPWDDERLMDSTRRPGAELTVPEQAAGHWRRHHRYGNGLCVRWPWAAQRHGGRTDADQLMPGADQGSGTALSEAYRQQNTGYEFDLGWKPR